MDNEVVISVPSDQLSTPPEEAIQPQETKLSPINPQTDVWSGDNCTIENCEHYLAWREAHGLGKPPVPGAGRKCVFCQESEKILAISNSYLKKFEELKTEKLSIPFIEELAVILHRNIDTMTDWANKKLPTGQLEHPEFNEIILRLKTVQKLRLLQRTLGRYNPTGAIFQLKANHGMMETEKKVVSGDTTEPLLIKIVEDRSKTDE